MMPPHKLQTRLRRLLQRLAGNNSAGMEPVVRERDAQHRQRIQTVEVHLLGLQLAGGAEDVLGHAEDTADHDEAAARVEDDEQLLPGRGERPCVVRGAREDAAVEDERDGDEEGEEEDLDGEAGDDDVLAEVEVLERLGLREDATAAGLHEEGEDVAEDEELGQPFRVDDRVVVRFEEDDQAAQDHVDGCG